MTVGENLREARLSLKLTQLEAAQQAGIHRTSLTAIEQNKRHINERELSDLARIYGVSTEYLLRGLNGSTESAYRMMLTPEEIAVVRAFRERDIASLAHILAALIAEVSA